jgi:O-antigen/teichoic acid export membrane protein
MSQPSESHDTGTELRFLLKHSSIYGLGTVLSRVVAFLLLPLYTRHLTPRDYGLLELVDVTTGIIGTLAGLGVSFALGRLYFDATTLEERGRLVSTTYCLAVLSSALLILFVLPVAPLLAAWILSSPEDASCFRIAFVGLLAGVLVDVGQVYLRLLYRSTLVISISLTSLVVGVTLNVVFIAYWKLGILGVLYSSLITRLLVGVPLAGWILARNGLRISLPTAVSLLRYSLPLLPSMIGTVITNYSDRYFIRHFVSIADAGLYGLAMKIGTSVHYLITSPFIMVFLPRRFEVARGVDGRRVLADVFHSFLSVSLLASLVVAVFVDEILILMTTPPFYPSAAFVPAILASMVLLGLRYHFDLGIWYERRTDLVMWINISVSVVQVALAYFLIPPLGIWGAVAASLGSLTLNAIAVYIVGSRLYPIPYDFRRALKLVGLILLAYVASRALPFLPLPLAICWKASIICLCAYTAFRARLLPTVGTRGYGFLAERSPVGAS